MKRILGISLAIVLANAALAAANLSFDLDKIVVTSSRFEQQDYKVGSNMTVISQEQIQASNASNISDLLKFANGVHIYDYNTNRTAVIDIRGFGDTAARNVLILINGRKVNAIDISAPDLGQIPLGAVERIEILRGAGSVLYGDNAVGGVVNIITKKGKGDLQGKIGAVYSSYDSLGEHIEFSGAYQKMSYFFYSKYLDQKGYRSNSDELSKNFNTRLGYEFSQNFSSDVEIGWHKDDTRLPGGLSAADLDQFGRRSSRYPSDYSSTKDRYFKLGMSAKPLIDSVYFGDISLAVLYRNRDAFDAFNTGGPWHTNRSIDTYGVTGKYVFDRTIFDKEVNFITGIDYYDHTNDIVGSGNNADDITIKKKEFGIYESLQLELVDHVFVNTATRYNKVDYEFHQRNVVVNQSQSPDKWVNSGGLKYEYAKESNLHLGWQQTFRFLATDEWYSTANYPSFGITPGLNLNLKQQSGVQYEAGVKHNFNDKVIVGITPYLIVNENEIFFDPITFGNSNYDKTRRMGIEFEQQVDLLKIFETDFFDKLKWMTSYTYQNARFDKGANDGKDIPMVPMHVASQSLNARIYKYYGVSLTGRYIGSTFAINDVQNSTDKVKPYEIFDVKMSYNRKNYEIYFAVNNVFDKSYYSYVAKSTFSAAKSYFPAPERNFSLGVDVQF
jgi:iron complex outermembrane receptor protein